MQLKKGQQIEVEISKLAFGGRGIGKYENQVVFIEGVVPGDRVLAALTRIKKSFLEAQLLKILSPAPARIEPRCRHFSVCGGCQWQFLDYQDQLKVKQDLVKETLEHIGGLKDIEFRPIIGAPSPWNYRNKMEYSFADDDNGRLEIGLHPPKKFREVFKLTECFLPADYDAFLVEAVRDFAYQHGLTSYNFRENRGLLRSLFIRRGMRTGEYMVNLVTSDENFGAVSDLVNMIVEKSAVFLKENKLVSVYHTVVYVAKGRKTSSREFLKYGKETYREEMKIIGGGTEIVLNFDVHPQAFFQPNPIQAEKLYALAVEAAGLSGQEVVYDLYCGTGTIALCLAQFARKVIGVEIQPDALKNARENAVNNQIANVDFKVGDVGEIFDEIKEKADVIVVDPPRAGLSADVLTKIAETKVKRIVYVSCNPSTFARDARLLVERGYDIKFVQPVDMLPQTGHIELVAELGR